MNLIRNAPFAVLAFFFGVLCLILACITSNRACYDQPYFGQYNRILGDNDCDYLCSSNANKLIGTPTTAAYPVGSIFYFPVRRVVRCPWQKTGARLFLAESSLLVLWMLIEFLLIAYKRYYKILHIFEVLTLGLAIPTAIYMYADLQHTECGPWYRRGFLCYSSIFLVSFVVLILAMCSMFLNILINWSRRNSLVEKKVQFSSIPQNDIPVDTHHVNVENRIA